MSDALQQNQPYGPPSSFIKQGGKWMPWWPDEANDVIKPRSPVCHCRLAPVSVPWDPPHPHQPCPNLCVGAVNIRMKTKQSHWRICKRHASLLWANSHSYHCTEVWEWALQDRTTSDIKEDKYTFCCIDMCIYCICVCVRKSSSG